MIKQATAFSRNHLAKVFVTTALASIAFGRGLILAGTNQLAKTNTNASGQEHKLTESLDVKLSIVEAKAAENGWSVVAELIFTNLGKESIKLDKISIVMDGKLSNNFFKITSSNAAGHALKTANNANIIEYSGIMGKRAEPGPDGYYQLKPGATIKTKVQLGDRYSFPKKGGSFSIQYETLSGTSKDKILNLVSNIVTFDIPGL